MIEIINTELQDVVVGGAALFNVTTGKCGCAEHHREGSGTVKLIKPGKYLVTFSANIAVPTGSTPGEISMAIAVDGEAVPGTIMRVTPPAAGRFFNIATQTHVDVIQCCGHTCCVDISVRNTSNIPITVDNPNLTAVKVS